MLREIVRTSGDECVNGYRYFRKIKKCSGYEEALKKTKKPFSVIKYAQIQEDGKCIVLISIRWWILLIFVIIGIIGTICATGSPKAGVIKDTKRPYVFEPDETIPELQDNTGNNMTISIPGYKQFIMGPGKEYIELYNPEKNFCRLKYYVYIQDECAGESGWLLPGQSTTLNFYEMITDGIYEAELAVKTGAMDGACEFNSVRQTVILKVDKGEK